jgi:hypothetical protein
MQEDIALKLPSMMRDSEAFVRRAVMELMVCLIVERECGTILLDDRNAVIMKYVLFLVFSSLFFSNLKQKKKFFYLIT